MNFTRNDFNSLVNFLRLQGYKIKVTEEFSILENKHILTGMFAVARNSKHVTFGFAWDKNKDKQNFYYHINDAIAADNGYCFDKWSKCPMRISLPQKHEDILKWLKILGTQKSFELSNSYEPIPDIPNDFNIKDFRE